MRTTAMAAVLLVVSGAMPCLAQQSASYRMDEHVLNLAGRPDDGVTASSGSYRITLDSFGEATVRTGLTSPSFRMDASFAGAYPPPGEVTGLRLVDHVTLTWNAERSVGTYAVYRDALGTLPGGYGVCWQEGLTDETTTDSSTPAAGTGWFYLVTADNRLREEGTKGRDSAGAERGGQACP